MKRLSNSGYDLLSRMLDYDPNKRITAAEALDHEYFKESPLPMKKYVLAVVLVLAHRRFYLLQIILTLFSLQCICIFEWTLAVSAAPRHQS